MLESSDQAPSVAFYPSHTAIAVWEWVTIQPLRRPMARPVSHGAVSLAAECPARAHLVKGGF